MNAADRAWAAYVARLQEAFEFPTIEKAVALKEAREAYLRAKGRAIDCKEG